MGDDSNEPTPPKVFISYSHDSADHKRWVAGLATKLREKGIDTILDQWDMSLGADLGHFMEQGLTTADRVLVICTPSYCKKANNGVGGVGYEKTILTKDLIRDTQTDKFVPVIRIVEGDPRSVVPTCLGTRLFIDLRIDSQEGFDELVRDIHRQPAATKPPVGKNPFAQTATGALIATPSPGTLLPTVAATMDPIQVYDQAILIARSKDFIAWRHLARDVRTKSLKALTESRFHLEKRLQGRSSLDPLQDISPLLDTGVAAVAPMFAMALAGVESGLPEIEHQEAVLDEVVNVAGWQQAGFKVVSDLPINLGFMYHYLHGAMAMQIGRVDLALDLARSIIHLPNKRNSTRVCNDHGLTGWTPVFQSNATNSWRYLQTFVQRETWIHHCFGSEAEALSSITAYGYAMTLDELASVVQRNLKPNINWQPDKDEFKGFRLNIPLFFAVAEDPVPQRGYQLFLKNKRSIPAIWQYYQVPDQIMPSSWESWLRGQAEWLSHFNFYDFFHGSESLLPHANLMVDLGLTNKRPFQRDD